MKCLLDSSTCIALLRDSSARVAKRFEETIARDGTISISSLVLCELWYGVHKSSRLQENAGILSRFLGGPVEVVSFDDEDAQVAAEIRAALAKTGKTIGSYDTLIAGQCVSKDLILITSNLSEFRRVKRLYCEDWAAK